WMHRLRGGKSVAMKKKNPKKSAEKVNHKFRGGLLGIKHFRVSTAKLRVSTASTKSFKITAVGEKVNAAESLLVVSTEVNVVSTEVNVN
ncbi:hypothetical protein Tco_0031265, partial [Tanacetum coccineum]